MGRWRICVLEITDHVEHCEVTGKGQGIVGKKDNAPMVP
jgi:hypothetical protein